MRDIPLFPHVNTAYTIFTIKLLYIQPNHNVTGFEWETFICCFMDVIIGWSLNVDKCNLRSDISTDKLVLLSSLTVCDYTLN